MIYGRTIICKNCNFVEDNTPPSKDNFKRIFFSLITFFILMIGYSFRNEIKIMLMPELALQGMSEQEIVSYLGNCSTTQKNDCMLRAFRQLNKIQPNNISYKANLAFQLTTRNFFNEADPIYNELLSSGVGTYDLMAYYARNLNGLNRVEESINWNEKALSVHPKLLDVTQDLARLYVKANRPLEAISLLKSFIERNPESEPALKGDIIADIEIAKSNYPIDQIRLVSSGFGHHVLPISLSNKNKSELFLIDTGATLTTMPTEDIKDSFPELMSKARPSKAKLADARIVDISIVTLPKLEIVGWSFKNIEVAFCDQCSRLLGMSILKHLKIQASAKGELYTLTLSKQ